MLQALLGVVAVFLSFYLYEFHSFFTHFSSGNLSTPCSHVWRNLICSSQLNYFESSGPSRASIKLERVLLFGRVNDEVQLLSTAQQCRPLFKPIENYMVWCCCIKHKWSLRDTSKTSLTHCLSSVNKENEFIAASVNYSFPSFFQDNVAQCCCKKRLISGLINLLLISSVACLAYKILENSNLF